MSKPTLPNLNRPGMPALQKQHDAVSISISRVLLVLIGFSLFCVLTLGAEDASLLRTDATITMPFADTRISFVAFLVIGPTVLISLTGYLHVLVGYWNSLGGRQYKGALPQIQNIRTVGALVVSGYLLYWITPTVLAVFAWKALPRPEGPWLVVVGSFVATALAWLQIYRQKIHRARWLKRIWILVPMAFATLFIVQGYYQTRFFSQSYYQLKNSFHPNTLLSIPPFVSTLTLTDVPPEWFPRGLLERRLQLGGADLSHQTITWISIKNGDLYSANLSNSVFAFTELSNADLRGANLANSTFFEVWLNDANLSAANLSGANFVIASLRHADLNNANLSRAQLRDADLQGAYLAGAQLFASVLENVNLRDADLSNADLRDSQGLTCEQLTQAKRWWEAGRAPNLACGRKIPTTLATLHYVPAPQSVTLRHVK